MSRRDNPTKILPLLSDVRIVVALVTCTLGSYNIGSIEVTLATFLVSLGLSVQVVAVAFFVMSISIMIITPVNGYLCERVSIYYVACSFRLMSSETGKCNNRSKVLD